MDENVQRALGRIEGTQAQILSELRRFQEVFGDHVDKDQASFSSLRVLINDQRQNLAEQFGDQARERNSRLDAQDKVLADLVRYVNWARGVSWPILGLLGIIGVVVCGVIIDLIANLMKLK